MNLGPDEHGSFEAEVPVNAKEMEGELSWHCAGCNHDYKKKFRARVRPNVQIRVNFWCPLCTPWWKSIWNSLCELLPI